MVKGLVVAQVVLAVGCGKILGIEDTSIGGDDDVAIDAAVAIDVPVAPPDAQFACADEAFDPAVGSTTLDTDTATDDVTLSCGSGAAVDRLFGWTAPVTDYYVFDTFGSEFDTVLGLLDGCDGGELACNQNAASTPQSEIVRKFEAGQSAVIAVDGFAGDSGAGTLAVSRVACPDLDLEGQTFPLGLSTTGFGDDFAGACGGAGNEDRAYHWVPETDGLYRFRAVSDAFRPTVSVFAGARCGDPTLGCNRSAALEASAEVVRFLRAGDVVGIEIDGVDGQGDFDIDIALQDGPACPESIIGENEIHIDQVLTERSLAPSCAPAFAVGKFGGFEELPDRTYGIDVSPVGTGCFGDVEVGVQAGEEIVLYALDQGDCGGRELACVQAVEIDAKTFEATLSLPADQDESRSYTVVVARARSGGGAAPFQIFTQPIIACAAK